MAILLFDGDCGFCAVSAARLASWSAGDLDGAPWHRADLEALGTSSDECRSAVQFFDQGGRVSGAAAIAGALRCCRRPWSVVGTVIRWPGIAGLAERVYRVVAAHRHRLPGSTAACRLD